MEPLVLGKGLVCNIGAVGLPCDAPTHDVCDRLGFMRRKCRRMMAFTTERMYVVKVEDGRAKASFPIKSVVLAPSDKVNQVLYHEGELDPRPYASGVVFPVITEGLGIWTQRVMFQPDILFCGEQRLFNSESMCPRGSMSIQSSLRMFRFS